MPIRIEKPWLSFLSDGMRTLELWLEEFLGER